MHNPRRTGENFTFVAKPFVQIYLPKEEIIENERMLTHPP